VAAASDDRVVARIDQRGVGVRPVGVRGQPLRGVEADGVGFKMSRKFQSVQRRAVGRDSTIGCRARAPSYRDRRVVSVGREIVDELDDVARGEKLAPPSTSMISL